MSSSVGPCEAPAMTVADVNTPRLHLTGQNLKLAEMIRKIAIFEAEHTAYFLGSPQCAKTRHAIAASTPGKKRHKLFPIMDLRNSSDQPPQSTPGRIR